MIVYQLTCEDGHEFESWFRDAATFDRHARAGKVDCPTCGSTRVAKAPMAPRPMKNSPSREAATVRAREVAQEFRKAVETVRAHVEKNCDYVGPRFPEEARRIHYGETEERGIYGEASDAAAAELAEEGISVARIPWPDRKAN